MMINFNRSFSGNKLIIKLSYDGFRKLLKCLMNQDANQQAVIILNHFVASLKVDTIVAEWTLNVEESELVSRALILSEVLGYMSEEFLGWGYRLLGESEQLRAKLNSEFYEKLAYLTHSNEKESQPEPVKTLDSDVFYINHFIAREYVRLFNQHSKVMSIEHTELHKRDFLKPPELNYEQCKTANTLAIQAVNYYLLAVQESKVLDTREELETYLTNNTTLTPLHFRALEEFQSYHKIGKVLSCLGAVDSTNLLNSFSSVCESILV